MGSSVLHRVNATFGDWRPPPVDWPKTPRATVSFRVTTLPVRESPDKLACVPTKGISAVRRVVKHDIHGESRLEKPGGDDSVGDGSTCGGATGRSRTSGETRRLDSGRGGPKTEPACRVPTAWDAPSFTAGEDVTEARSTTDGSVTWTYDMDDNSGTDDSRLPTATCSSSWQRLKRRL